MTNRESILPVDAYTSGLRDDQIAGLVARHGVRFEIGPNQITRRDESITRHGWVIDLYGVRSSDDARMPSDAANDHVWDVLSVIAHAVLPSDEGPLDIDVEPYAGRVVVDPKRNYLEEVQLRMTVQLETEARLSMVGEADTTVTDRIADKLIALGARRHG